jgi:hypothetical protein
MLSRTTPAGAVARCPAMWRHAGCVPEVDDDQLAALRRLRAAFGPIEVVEVIRHDQVVGDDPEEHGQAHALLVRAVTDPDWQAASQALDELMGKLVVVRRLLEAEERLPTRTPRADPM